MMHKDICSAAYDTVLLLLVLAFEVNLLFQSFYLLIQREPCKHHSNI